MLRSNEMKKSQYFQPVPDFEMTITLLNSNFYVEFDKVSGISRHFHEAQTLNFLRVIVKCYASSPKATYATIWQSLHKPSITNILTTSSPHFCAHDLESELKKNHICNKK